MHIIHISKIIINLIPKNYILFKYLQLTKITYFILLFELTLVLKKKKKKNKNKKKKIILINNFLLI